MTHLWSVTNLDSVTVSQGSSLLRLELHFAERLAVSLPPPTSKSKENTWTLISSSLVYWFFIILLAHLFNYLIC